MRLIFLFVCLHFSLSLKGEHETIYNNDSPVYFIKASFKLTNNENKIGYIPLLYDIISDSISNHDYLTKQILQSYSYWENIDSYDTLCVYDQLIEYSYYKYPNGSDSTYTIYSLSSPPYFLIKKHIQNIIIHSIIREDNASLKIEHPTTSSDWLKSPPIDRINFDVDICNYQIYIHERNVKLVKLLRKIESKIYDINNHSSSVYEMRSNETSLDNYYKNRFKLENKYDKLMEEFNELLLQLKPYKVVIVSICVC